MKLKKMAAMVMAAVLSVSVLAGCGGGGGNNTPVTPGFDQIEYTVADDVTRNVTEILEVFNAEPNNSVIYGETVSNMKKLGKERQEAEEAIEKVKDNPIICQEISSALNPGLKTVAQQMAMEAAEGDPFDFENYNQEFAKVYEKVGQVLDDDKYETLMAWVIQGSNYKTKLRSVSYNITAQMVACEIVGALDDKEYEYEVGAVPVEGTDYCIVSFGAREVS